MKGQIDKMQQDFRSSDEKVKEERESQERWINHFMDKNRQVLDKIKEERESQEKWMKDLMDEHKWYVNKYGPSEPFLKRIEEFEEQIDPLPPDDGKYTEYDY